MAETTGKRWMVAEASRPPLDQSATPQPFLRQTLPISESGQVRTCSPSNLNVARANKGLHFKFYLILVLITICGWWLSC